MLLSDFLLFFEQLLVILRCELAQTDIFTEIFQTLAEFLVGAVLPGLVHLAHLVCKLSVGLAVFAEKFQLIGQFVCFPYNLSV